MKHIAALLLASTLLVGCQPEEPARETTEATGSTPISESAATGSINPPHQVPLDQLNTHPSGLKYADLKVGTGQTANQGDTVDVHYTGWLMDGTKFDSSVDRGQPFTFTLGAGQVIQGWDEGVAGMKEGGTRLLVLPPELAYGEHGAPPTIPPGATLMFQVELLDVKQ